MTGSKVICFVLLAAISVAGGVVFFITRAKAGTEQQGQSDVAVQQVESVKHATAPRQTKTGVSKVEKVPQGGSGRVEGVKPQDDGKTAEARRAEMMRRHDDARMRHREEIMKRREKLQKMTPEERMQMREKARREKASGRKGRHGGRRAYGGGPELGENAEAGADGNKGSETDQDKAMKERRELAELRKAALKARAEHEESMDEDERANYRRRSVGYWMNREKMRMSRNAERENRRKELHGREGGAEAPLTTKPGNGEEKGK